jgi:tetratricopeptide (TPR) repeat protein
MNAHSKSNSSLNYILPAVILLATFITYSNHFHNALHFDDVHTISNNLYVRDISNIPKFFTDGTTGSSLRSNQSYRPVLTTTLAIDYWLQGGIADTFWFHVTSFTFFILQGILMFALFKRIIEKSSDTAPSAWISAFAVAWYMLHPACAETVNYIIQRGDSLSTFFVLLGVAMYVFSSFSKKFYLYLIPVVLGVLTKPSALMFAPLLLVYIVLFEEGLSFSDLIGNKNSSALKVAKYSAASFALIVVMYFVVKKMQPETYVEGASSAFLYRITQPFIMFHQFRTWFSPTWLSADTDWMIFDKLSNPYVIGGFVFVIIAGYVMWVASAFRKTLPIAFGIAWFFIANIPTTIIAFSEVTNDHRMFFPFVGLALAVTWALYLLVDEFSYLFKQVPTLKNALTVCMVMMLVGYAYGTYQRNIVWKTDESLWADVAEKSPKNGRGLMNYGLALMARGDYAGAEFYYTQALKYSPNYSYLHINMAILKDAVGKQDEAEAAFRKGIQFSRGSANARFYYGRYLYKKNRKPEAVAELLISDSLAPSDIGVKYLLMDALYDLARFPELKIVAENTLQLFPGDARAIQYKLVAEGGKSKVESLQETASLTKDPKDFLNLSLYYYGEGKYEDCIKACEEAIKLKPNYPEAYNNICSAYNAMNRFAEGAKACEEALKLKPDFQLAKNNLNWAKKNIQ